MSTASTNTELTITAIKVAEKDRNDFFVKHLGLELMIDGESLIFSYARQLASNYKGGAWDFYELSNGGFYIAPKYESLDFDYGTMSGDAAGIAVTLFALNHLLWAGEQCNRLRENYYHLRDFAYQHKESQMIHRVID